jgi:uncharacterized RDD family membrane protein YckC
LKTHIYSPYAGFTRRLAAVLLDALLVLFLLRVLSWALRVDLSSDLALFAVTLQWIGCCVLVALFWLLFQGTPGKLLLGCRIVDAHTGGRPQPWQILVRLLGYAVSAAPAGLGFFWIFWDARRQAWHDKLARTLVVIDDESTKTLADLSAECR